MSGKDIKDEQWENVKLILLGQGIYNLPLSDKKDKDNDAHSNDTIRVFTFFYNHFFFNIILIVV